MEAFANLLDRLYYTHSNLAKAALLLDYFQNTPDPDRGYAVAALAGTLNFDLFKRHLIIQVVESRVDMVLYNLSRDYVGDTSETVAHIWPVSAEANRLNRLPSLSEVIEHFHHSSKEEIRHYLELLLDNMTPTQRWALIKLGTRGLRVGVSARFIKNVLAQFGNKDINEIESVWHGLQPPYTALFDWLEGKAEKPDVTESINFHPVMLAHPIEDRELALITPGEFVAEWKFDGIRVQIVSSSQGKSLFTRTGDDISHSFPDIMEHLTFHGVLDGELVVKHGDSIASFNDLQQRLNKKKPTRQLIETYPTSLVIYDALELEGQDIRNLPLTERRERMQSWYQAYQPVNMVLSELLPFHNLSELEALRAKADRQKDNFIEGLMLKRADSHYIPGRPKGYWYKWKRDPLTVDAVLMYAQRGSGKRSSYYSDYTFGLWKDGEILPIGKAYSGFTDEELKKLDSWIRNHTTQRFGPVREVKKEMVFEVAFDSAHTSPRHKSGYALRFPRIHRIRWDKPASEADKMEALEQFIAK